MSKTNTGVMQTLQMTGKHDDEQQRKGGTDDIERIRHPEWCRAKHDITNGTATYGDGYSTHIATKPVEMLGCGMTDS